jgi:iron(III) transport system substrate-binding protein
LDPRTATWLIALAGLALGSLAAPLWSTRRHPAGPALWTVLLAGFLLLVARTDLAPGTARHLRVLSVLDDETTTALLDEFQRQSGIVCEVDPFAGGAQEAVDLLLEERLQPDLLLGGTVEIHDQLAQRSLLLSCDLEADDQRLDQWDQPRSLWTPIYVGYLALIHRPLPELRTRPPEWITLLDPRFRNLVTIPSPETSGGGLVFLATQLQRAADEERGWAFLEGLLRQGAVFETRSEDAITKVAEGTKDLGVAWAQDVWRRRERDRIPVELHIPHETGYEIGGVSILSWTRDAEAARELVRFLTGRDAGRIQARTGYRVALRRDVSPPAYLQRSTPVIPEELAFFDRAAVTRDRARWMKRWRDLVAGRTDGQQ